MYARGILFGKMKYELGDHSFVRCPENDFVADIEFKTKGYFSGTYNAIGGTIKNEKTGEVFYEISGLWNGEMHIKNVHVCLALMSLSSLCICKANLRSRTTKRSFSMRGSRNRHSPQAVLLSSKTSASLSDYGEAQ